MATKKSKQAIREAGYQSGLKGEPCESPTTRELDRMTWEMGWRDGHREGERAIKGSAK